MPKIKLDSSTAARIQCEPGKKKTDWYDEAVTGFVLECRSTGGKTFYLRYDRDGRQCQHKIGRYDDITFAAAKKAAQRLRSQVVMGGDPAAAKAVAKSIPLYRELAAMHLADAKLHQRSYSTTEAYVRLHLLPRFGRMRVNEIDGRAIGQFLAAKRDEGLAPATVVKIKAIFHRSFELGKRWDVPGCDRNPVRGIQTKPLNNARHRYLAPEEATRLMAAAIKSANPHLAAIVGLLLLTGMRVSELLSARLEYVDFTGRTLYLPTSKNGRSRHVPLATAAIEILEGLRRNYAGEYLFPSPHDPAKHLTTIKHSWQTARAAAGLPGLRVHDLRHSAASAMLASGVDLFTIGKVLGHQNVVSTARYAHLSNSSLLAAVDRGAAMHITSL